jgi:hypothetical protein
MVYDIRSITQVGTSEPFELQVSRDQISGHKSLFKFGFNPDIDNTLETVWDAGGLYAYPSSAVKMTATSTDGANDEDVQVTVQGLDADYNELSETITLDGSGVAETNGFFLRVFRAFVEGSQVPSGTINITNSSVTYAKIILGNNQTLMALWTVPAGYTAYLLQSDVTVATTQNNKYATVHFTVRKNGGVFRTQDKFVKAQSSHHQQYHIPLKFEEKTDLEFRAIGDSSGADIAISASMDILYIQNAGPL